MKAVGAVYVWCEGLSTSVALLCMWTQGATSIVSDGDALRAAERSSLTECRPLSRVICVGEVFVSRDEIPSLLSKGVVSARSLLALFAEDLMLALIRGMDPSL